MMSFGRRRATFGRGQVLDENFLMTAATFGGFLRSGNIRKRVAVMLFYQVGELFQSYAVSRSRRSIAALMDIRPDTANVLRNGEVLRDRAGGTFQMGETIIVNPGERVPFGRQGGVGGNPLWIPPR